MNTQQKDIIRGVLTSLITLILVGAALGLALALSLLVFSMEEGGNDLSTLAVGAAQGTLLLMQGIGIHTGVFTLTLLPLTLSVLTLIVLYNFALRLHISWFGAASALITWLIVNALLLHSLEEQVIDIWWLAVLKSALFCAIGIFPALIREHNGLQTIEHIIKDHTNANVWKSIDIARRIISIFFVSVAVISTIIVITWISLNWRTVADFYEITGMATGSRILSTALCLAWLVNVLIWAFAWSIGVPVHLADNAQISLWQQNIDTLPHLPVLGILPQKIDQPWLIVLLMLIPLLLSFVIGLLSLWSPLGYKLRVLHEEFSWQKAVDLFLYPFVTVALSSVAISLIATLLFVLSNGSIGSGHFAHVGVNMIEATRSVAQPAAAGLFGAWLTAVLFYAALGLSRIAIAAFREKHGKFTNTETLTEENAVHNKQNESNKQVPSQQSQEKREPRTAHSSAGQTHASMPTQSLLSTKNEAIDVEPAQSSQVNSRLQRSNERSARSTRSTRNTSGTPVEGSFQDHATRQRVVTSTTTLKEEQDGRNE